MANLDEEVAQFLEDEGVGTFGTDIFVSKLNDAVNDTIAVIDTGGMPPDDYLPLPKRTIQIIVRRLDQAESISVAREIRDLLHNRFWQDVSSTGTIFQLRSTAMQEPTPIGQDEKNRYEVTCNYLFLTR